MLALARDLGERLLPAFATPLGIPVHRVNLRKGIPRGEQGVAATVLARGRASLMGLLLCDELVVFCSAVRVAEMRPRQWTKPRPYPNYDICCVLSVSYQDKGMYTGLASFV